MKSYTRIAAVVVAAAVVLGATGCAPAASSDGKTTLTFFYWGEAAELEAKQKLISDYEAANPNVTIDATYTTGVQSTAKLETYFSSNTAPDVISLSADAVDAYYPKNVFEDLTPYVEKDGLEGSWDQDLVDAVSRDGKLLGLPQAWKTLAIAYNKNLFDAAGIEYPTADWTEDDFTAAAKAIAGTDDQGAIYGFDPNWYLYWGIRNTYGDPSYSIADNKMTAEGNKSYTHGLELFSDLTNEGVALVPGSGAASSATFVGGRVGMQVIGAWDPAAYSDQIGDAFGWDVINLPVDSEYGAWTAPLFLDSLAISNKSSKKDAAWDFIKFLSTNEDAQKTAGVYGFPALTTVAATFATDFSDGAAPFNRQAFIDQKKVSWAFAGIWASINDEEKSLMDQVLTNQITVDDMVSQLQEFGDGVLG